MTNPTTQTVRRARFAVRRLHRGMTLIELMIAVSIMGFVLIAISAAFIAMLQLERKNSVVLDMGTDAIDFQRTLQKYAAAAQQIVSPDGLSVRITSTDGTVTVIRYMDDDGDPATIDDNRIELLPNIALGNVGILLVRNVSPPNLVDPIFVKDNTVGYSPLLIEFVIGDYARDLGDSSDSVTGPGFEAFTFRARISPRNTL